MGFFQILTTGVLSVIITVSSGNLILPSTPAQVWMIVILTVVCTCFGFTLQLVVQSKLPSKKVALFCALGPFTAVLLGPTFMASLLYLGTGICMSAIILSFEGGESLSFSKGSVLILCATLCWGIENKP